MDAPEEKSSIDFSNSTIIFQSDNGDEIDVASLVLSSQNIPYHVVKTTASGWQITTASHFAVPAATELHWYFLENKQPKRHSGSDPSFCPAFQAMNFVIVAVLLLIYLSSGPWNPGASWFIQAAGDSEKILAENEYYRLVTSLFLHADTPHILNNCLFGGLMLYYYFHLTGNGLGLLMLICGSLSAQLINCLVHGEGHHFVGFSTAVFYCAGFLSSFRAKRFSTYGKFAHLMPLMAASALLALLGSEGERTDLGAHFFGLLTGLIFGYLFSIDWILRWRNSTAAQLLCGFTACLIVTLAWYASSIFSVL